MGGVLYEAVPQQGHYLNARNLLTTFRRPSSSWVGSWGRSARRRRKTIYQRFVFQISAGLMKSLYLSFSGHCYTEDVPPSARQVELFDGFHPLTAGSVWRDVDHKQDALMFVKQGVSAPEGDALVHEVVYESERLKFHLRGIGVSRMWARHLVDFIIKIFYGATVVMSFIGIYLTVWVILAATTGVYLPV